MKKKMFLSLLFLFTFGAVLLFAGGGGQAAGQAAKEATAPKIYQSGFTPSGTAAAEYQDKLNWFTNNFIQYFTSRGEGTKILGYDTPLKVRTTIMDSPGLQTSFAAWRGLYGESPTMNRYIDVYKRAFNVDVSYQYTIQQSDYRQQMRLNMAANDLPDIFSIQEQADVFEMAQADVIHDLTPYRAKYSAQIVENYWKDSPLLDMVSQNGKLYALPQTWPATDPLSYLWIRADWLKALNLELPKTMDDLTRIIDAFMKSGLNKSGRESIGISFGKEVIFLNRGLFTGFGAYPDYWVEKNGALIWGGTDENNKKALAFMNDLYKRGYVDKEFVTYTDAEMLEAVISGQCGVFYSPHWYISNTVVMGAQDKDADLWAIPLPTADGRPAMSPISPSNVGFTVVNKKFTNPELAYKMFNLFVYMYEGRDGSWWGFNPPAGGSNANDLSAFARIYSPWLNYDAYESFIKSFQAGWDKSLINAAADLYWGPVFAPETAWGWGRLINPEFPRPAFRELKTIVDEKRFFYDAYTGVPSDYMRDRWQVIKDEQLVFFTRMITGDLDVNAGFDAWLRTFNSMGGDRITREVNDWYRARK